MIAKQCDTIGTGNTRDLNGLLLEALMTFGTFDIEVANLDLNRLPSQLERSHSQLSAGAQQNPLGELARGNSTTEVAGAASASKKMSKEQEEELKEMLTRFQLESSPIRHILTLNSFFFTKFSEEKSKLQSEHVKYSQQLEILELTQKNIELTEENQRLKKHNADK